MVSGDPGNVTPDAWTPPTPTAGSAFSAAAGRRFVPFTWTVSPTRDVGGCTSEMDGAFDVTALLTVYVSAEPPVRIARKAGMRGNPPQGGTEKEDDNKDKRPG